MEFAHTFLPTAASVGLLPVITWFFMLIALYAFIGNFIFALSTRTSVAPEHRISRNYTAIIAAVAGISYFLIQSYYHDMLEELAHLSDPDKRLTLINRSYNAIGQLRYMDWAVTTPLLLLKIVSMVKIRYRDHQLLINTLLIADFFMILTGYIGEQQLSVDNQILVVPKLIWGAVSTIGYVIVLLTLWRIWRTFAQSSSVHPEERWGFRLMALMTATFWGVYPIGYILTTMEGVNLNWIHIAFSVADIINKVGVGAIAFQAAEQVLERRVSEAATAPYHTVG
ncbi:bacteriorhodopsin [Spirosoma pollinicola]|uniref:Rhodopsin n=1 Tax=Spirosoma pollinicola TaxID=2057025 RepID=A0A2K8Z7L7_9BACT|nr:bacteriorhodopsin [Spirosoma pollinicola]AUD05865.1 hypothetical protein CWM47_30870 [Spirosoma pollinicola]RYF76427.1 MAG: hypothetical protein EOO39_05595 [Cytophagaceae bacterium]